ncbi:MAG TPA: hypothetical protein VFK03_03635, partial [Candidatus Saccharimonadales bacterium]|nr:hypothetical protein [Candidatus Saccharimonadales bacterium]
ERSLPKALACIDAIRRGDVLANVIVFDANLTGATKQLGHDAVCIADAIQAANLTVHAIGYSALPMSRFGVAVAEDAQKDPFRLIEILDGLPENQPTNSQD